MQSIGFRASRRTPGRASRRLFLDTEVYRRTGAAPIRFRPTADRLFEPRPPEKNTPGMGLRFLAGGLHTPDSRRRAFRLLLFGSLLLGFFEAGVGQGETFESRGTASE